MCIRDRNIKFDELKNQINEINKRLENTHEIIETSFNRLEQNIEKMVESVEKQMYKNVVLENKVTNDNNDVENDNIIKNVVSESDTLKIDSEIVSESERIMGCNGVVISVDELEKEWRERVDEYVGQRVNFPLICDEPGCSQVLLLKGKRPVLLEDLNCFPFLYKLIPSLWNGVESMSCLLYTSRCV